MADPADWPGLRSLIRVCTERNGPDGRQRSVRHCISSRPVDAEALLALVRGHWGVENGLHRTLDVAFREDDCRLRRGHAPAVMGILRRAALNIVRTLQQNFRPDLSIGLLRDKIGRNPRPAGPDPSLNATFRLPCTRDGPPPISTRLKQCRLLSCCTG